MGPIENLSESTSPNYGNQWESGIVMSDSDQVLGNSQINTIPLNKSSTKPNHDSNRLPSGPSRP